MEKDSTISLRVPADLRAELERLAKADDRKLSTYAIRVLREHVDRLKAAGGKPKKS